jgi:hypothetical protein
MTEEEMARQAQLAAERVAQRKREEVLRRRAQEHSRAEAIRKQLAEKERERARLEEEINRVRAEAEEERKRVQQARDEDKRSRDAVGREASQMSANRLQSTFNIVSFQLTIPFKRLKVLDAPIDSYHFSAVGFFFILSEEVPLHERMAQQFRERVVKAEEDERQRALAALRDQRRPIDVDRIREHERKVRERQQRFEQELAEQQRLNRVADKKPQFFHGSAMVSPFQFTVNLHRRSSFLMSHFRRLTYLRAR